MTPPPPFFYICWHFDSVEKVEFVENLTEVSLSFNLQILFMKYIPLQDTLRYYRELSL